ncbi:MAG: ATP-binding cassette domain-containing protein [Deinococcales bacterium]
MPGLTSHPNGALVAQAIGVGFRYPGRPDILVQDVDLALRSGTVSVLVGANGSGKTTLLRVLAGEIAPRVGRLVWDARARLGFLPQGLPAAGDGPALAGFGDDDVDEARRLLGALGVAAALVEGPLDALSAGQRCKVALVRMLLDAPNVLVLDEPTTHLDLPGIEMLEDALTRYRGTLVLVSHDRYLRERIANRRWHVQGGSVEDLGADSGDADRWTRR